jgi:hypothetical protein
MRMLSANNFVSHRRAVLGRVALIALMCQALTTAALAQVQALPPALAGLPEQVKSLKWQTIDMKKVTPLEQCRALLLMNHTLDELSANATAEADLMSAYIEAKNLGAAFASTPPPPAPKALTFADAEKVAVAMLRGPMSTSYYATELSDMGPAGLASYQQMYDHTCQRVWSEFEESRHLVRVMSSYLGNSQKLGDYDAWATAETARREAQSQQRAAAKGAAAAETQKMDAKLREQQLELMQMQGALAAAHAQEQQQSKQSQQSQQNQGSTGGQTETPAGQPAQAVNGGFLVDGAQGYDGYGAWGGYGAYGGYGGYGYGYGAAAAGAYAGATAAHDADRNDAARAVANNADRGGQYHAANSSWNRGSSYGGEAHAHTQERMNSFHGASRGRR